MHNERTAIGIPMAKPSLLLEGAVPDSSKALTLTGSTGDEEARDSVEVAVLERAEDPEDAEDAEDADDAEDAVEETEVPYSEEAEFPFERDDATTVRKTYRVVVGPTEEVGATV